MKIVSDLMVPLEEYNHVFVGTTLQDAIKVLAQAMMGPARDPSRPRDGRGLLSFARFRGLENLDQSSRFGRCR